MSAVFLVNGVIIENFYAPTLNQTGPPTNYLESGIDINNNFMLYVHGTRKACGYLVKGTDVGNNYQYDTPTTVINLGTYTFSTTWNPVSTQFANANWIWTVANANITAPGSSDGAGYYYWFYYTFYYSGSANTGKVYAICDSNCVVYFNSTSVATIANGFGSATATGYNINIVNGLNFMRIAAYNSGYGITTTLTIQNTLTYTQSSQIYSFTVGSGTVSFSVATTASVLIVGGGGGGGTAAGLEGSGGGGGGGLLYGSITFAANTAYTFTVGTGGSAASKGSNSSIVCASLGVNELAPGGGAGGSGNAGGGALSNGQPGGSGGGGNGYGTLHVGGASTGFAGALTAKGNAGGSGGHLAGGGGGGGAGAAGTSTTDNGSTNGGNGGGGFTWPTNSVVYGGGGGGGIANGGSTLGLGGSGGGANGGVYGGNGSSAIANRGGGGGGAGGSSGSGGSGGSGIIIISLPISNNPAGLLVSVYDAGSVNVANSDSNWAYSQNTANLSTTTYSNASGALTFNTSAT